jgi:hypothetical protein
MVYSRFLDGSNHGRLLLLQLKEMADTLGVSPGTLLASAGEPLDASAPDAVKLEAALAQTSKKMSRDALARSLGWDLTRLRDAAAALKARLEGTGQALLVDPAGLALRPAVDALTPEERTAVARAAVPRKGLPLHVAGLLRDVLAGAVTIEEIEARQSHRVALAHLLVLGYLEYDGQSLVPTHALASSLDVPARGRGHPEAWVSRARSKG